MKSTNDINTIIRSHDEVATATVNLINERRAGKVAGLRTYLGTFDNKVEPIMPGDLGLVYAMSGHGKTTWSMAWLDKHDRANASAGREELSVYVTAETLVEAAMTYLMSIETGIDRRLIKRGELDDAEFERVAGTSGYVAQFAGRNIFFVGDSYVGGRDQPPLSPRYIQDAIWAIEDWRGLKVRTVFIDYLNQLDMHGYEGEKLTYTYMNVMKALKGMAKHNGWQLVLLAQAKQEVETRDDPIPTVHDIENSNSPRQVADFMFGLMRPWLYHDTKSCLAAGSDYHGYTIGNADGKYDKRAHQASQFIRLNKQKDGAAPIDHLFWLDPATARIINPDPYTQVDLNG